MVDVERVHRRDRADTGFDRPRCFDDSPQPFLRVAPPDTGILQRVLHVPGHEWGLDERARSFDLLEEAAVYPAESNCRVIGRAGSNWVHCRGTTGPAGIERFCDHVRAVSGVPFLMAGHRLVVGHRLVAGHRLVEGLRAIGARTISVVSGDPDRSAGISAHLDAARFEILWAGDLVDQGLVADHDEELAIEAETPWDHPNHPNHPMAAAAVDAHVFDELTERYGTAPPVLDRDDLLQTPLQRPATMVATWCDHVGIPFRPDALPWEPGPRHGVGCHGVGRPEVGWWDGCAGNLRDSDGRTPRPRREPSLAEAPSGCGGRTSS